MLGGGYGAVKLVVLVHAEQVDHQQQQEAHARQHLEADRVVHERYRAGAPQVAYAAAVPEDVPAEVVAREDAQHGEEHIGDGAHGLQPVHALHVYRRGDTPEAVAQVEQQHAARRQDAALEAAAGAYVAVQYDVEAQHERYGQVAVRQGADYEVVALPLLIHCGRPPISWSDAAG